MKPRKKHRPKGLEGVEEKLYDSKREDSGSYKDYWRFAPEKDPLRAPSASEKVKKAVKKKEPDQKYHYVRFTLLVFLAASLLFFLFSVSTAIYVFLSGSLFVSPENVIINIVGESTVSAGEEVNLDITVRNRNNANIYNAQLILRYPEEARNPDNPGSRINTQRIDLGDLRADGVKRHNTSFNLFGKEGETYTFVVDLAFTFEGSGALYEKGREFDLKIKDTPVSLELIGPDEVYINGRNEYTVRVRSDTDKVQENLVVRIEYPLSFYLSQSDGDLRSGLWLIERLDPGEEEELNFVGIFRESSLDEKGRTVSVYVGPADDIATRIATAEIIANIDSNPFEVQFFLDKGDNIYFGEIVEGDLVWRNNIGIDVEKAYLELILNNKDLKDVFAEGARVNGNKLVWTEKDLDFSKSEGVIPFSFRTEPRFVNDRLLEVEAVFEGDTLKGERVLSDYSESFSIATTFGVDVTTELSRVREPVNFKAGETITLDVSVGIRVGVSGAKNVQLIGTFPPSVSIESLSSKGESVRIEEDGAFIWNIGFVDEGVGVWKRSDSFRRKFDMKLNVIPKEDTEWPIAIEEIQLSGEDAGTGMWMERSFYNIPVYGSDPLYLLRE